MASKDEQRITVVGGGGIGGTVAACLTLAGERLTLVDRSREHVNAIKASGLKFEGPDGAHTVRIDRVLCPEELDEPLGVVLVAVKSQDTDDALESLLPRLGAESIVVSLQNGWNAQKIADRIGVERTVGAMVHMVAYCDAPGHVTRFTTGDFYLGELDGTCTDRARRLATRISAAVPCHPSENVWGYIWSKQIYGATMPTNALVDALAKETYAHDWVKTILLGIMFEGIQVADAEGIKLEAYERFDPDVMRVASEADLPAAIAALPKGSSKGNSSGWYDLKNHKKTEVEHLGGELVRRGRRHGIPMTLIGGIVEMVVEIESGKRMMDLRNLERLRVPARELVHEIVTSGALRRSSPASR